jgi:hypothetical protein
MLLAYYLIVRNMKNVSFIYVWIGDSHEPSFSSAILKDMIGIFSSFMKREYDINSKNFLTYTQVNEMNFDRTMCESMDLKEIYYSPMKDDRIASIPLNIARSIAKPGTVIASRYESEITPKRRVPNTHTDNVMKGLLTNPQLIDRDAVYNKTVPEARIQEGMITFTTSSQVSGANKPIFIYINPLAEAPKLNLTPEQLDSMINEEDINYKELLSYVNRLKKYYNDLGIGEFVRRNASNKVSSLVSYVVAHLSDELKDEVLNMQTDKYIFVLPDEQ